MKTKILASLVMSVVVLVFSNDSQAGGLKSIGKAIETAGSQVGRGFNKSVDQFDAWLHRDTGSQNPSVFPASAGGVYIEMGEYAGNSGRQVYLVNSSSRTVQVTVRIVSVAGATTRNEFDRTFTLNGGGRKYIGLEYERTVPYTTYNSFLIIFAQ